MIRIIKLSYYKVKWEYHEIEIKRSSPVTGNAVSGILFLKKGQYSTFNITMVWKFLLILLKVLMKSGLNFKSFKNRLLYKGFISFSEIN